MAVNSVDLTVKHGEFVCILGATGSGKSSLLSSIIGDLLYVNPELKAQYGERELTQEEFKLVDEQANEHQITEAPVKIS